MDETAQQIAEKLALLRKLAAEGFEQLDRGQGLTLESPRQVADLISEIGRNAAITIKRRTSGD